MDTPASGPANGRQALSAADVERLEPLTTAGADEPSPWTARRLGLRSHQLAHAGERALRARLANAQAAMAALNARRRGQRRVAARPARQAAVAARVARDHVQGGCSRRSEEQRRQRPVRRYGARPAMVRVEPDGEVTARGTPATVEDAVRQLGWRVSATTQPADQRSLGQAVLASRNASLIERDRARLQGRPLSLTPLDLARNDHVTGLIRLLALGLRGRTRPALVVRRRLAPAHPGLAGR